jgi:hypothetical protein
MLHHQQPLQCFEQLVTFADPPILVIAAYEQIMRAAACFCNLKLLSVFPRNQELDLNVFLISTRQSVSHIQCKAHGRQILPAVAVVILCCSSDTRSPVDVAPACSSTSLVTTR